MGKNPKLGDIYEIKTPTGMAYVQYTHDNASMGQLVRVLPGLFDARPTDFAELSQMTELYFVFYTLKYAVKDHQAKLVAHQPVPKWAQPYPLMRWGGFAAPGGKRTWKIFSALSELTPEEHERTPLLYDLTAEQQKLSIRVLRPHPAMVKELARGWTPEREEEFRLQSITEKQQASSPTQSRGSEPMKHYLYFSKKPQAEKAEEHLRSRGFSVQVRKGAGGEDWLATATSAPPKTGDQMEALRNEMEALAAQFGGEYDGWETAVDPQGEKPSSAQDD